MKHNLLVLQSGGPTAVINASLAGVIASAKKNENVNKIYGAVNGIHGVLNDNLVDLSDMSDEDLAALKVTPAAYLGSVRHQLPKEFLDYKFNIAGDYITLQHFVKVKDIGYIVVIGGNDSMDTVDKLSRFYHEVGLDVHVIGVPKTIDNDLVLTDHTPGYGSALKYIATEIEEIKLDTAVYEKGRVTVVEIMGRDAGWLTAGAKLACLNGLGPDLIYLPESPFDMGKFLKDVKEIYDKKQKVLVAISEGIRNAQGNYITSKYSYSQINDVFGHQQLGGASTVLADLVKEVLGIPVRRMELNLPQRCAGHLLSRTDMEEAYQCGSYAAEMVSSTTGKFVIMTRDAGEEYHISYSLVDVSEVANKVKEVPASWIVGGNDISDEFIKYALPLVQGEVALTYENGLPKYLKR